MGATSTVDGTEGSETLPAARTTSEAIAVALRNDIVTGRFQDGERLRQVELARRFGVSTTPVREAFGILQRQGLVRVNAQRGAIVLLPTTQDLREHYEIRIALECLAAEHAALRYRAPNGPRLEKLMEQMRTCRDPDRYLDLNHEFHMAVYALSGRPRLLELIEQLRLTSRAYLQMSAEAVVPTGEAEREHDEIFAACVANDPAAAQAATRRHLQHTVDMVAEQLPRTDEPA